MRRPILAGAAVLLASTAISSGAWAQTAPDTTVDEVVITGSLGALPVKDVGTIFGFDKNLVETPRSASTVSQEQIQRFGVTEIYDLVAQAPGTFTNSFFGVGGSLDIRGTPGEVYFRGMRRLDNPGNYPTPIGAADRIDIVRGPASPIMGPAKTGGYINFVPKSARAGDGSYLSAPKADMSFTRSSWNGNVLAGSIVGPGKIGGKEFGYSLYAEYTDSDSFYENIFTKQSLIQGSIDTDLTDNLTLSFGGMYDDFDGVQNGGWNRVTQDLLDTGRYITGTARPLDTNGDGKISQAEVNASGGLNLFGSFACGGGSPFSNSVTNACLTANPQYGLINTGTATLDPSKVLTGPNDILNNKAKTFYADLTWTGPEDLEIKNSLFYDAYKNLNENAYGFSQFADSYVIEDKVVASKKWTNDMGVFALQVSPSIRYTDFAHGDDFGYEFFGRVDLTQGYTPNSTRLLSTQTDSGYSSYFTGHYTDTALSALFDADFAYGFDITGGARYDNMNVSSTANLAKMDVSQFGVTFPDPVLGSAANIAKGSVTVDDTKGVWSYSLSVNYKAPFGLIPYVTASKQSVIITGQGAEVDPTNVASDKWITESELQEVGIKGSWLDSRLYAAVSGFKQTRTDYSIASLTVNQAIETTGAEAEARWAVNDHLLLTGAYTHTKVVNLAFLNGGGTIFYYTGVEYLNRTGVNPINYLGGALSGLVPFTDNSMAERPGIPRDLVSGTGTYAFDNGFAISASATHVPSGWADYVHTLKLPEYTLVDLGVTYENEHWMFRFNVKNALDEKYYRANFVELYASQNIKPELPRSLQAAVKYKF